MTVLPSGDRMDFSLSKVASRNIPCEIIQYLLCQLPHLSLIYFSFSWGKFSSRTQSRLSPAGRKSPRWYHSKCHHTDWGAGCSPGCSGSASASAWRCPALPAPPARPSRRRPGRRRRGRWWSSSGPAPPAGGRPRPPPAPSGSWRRAGWPPRPPGRKF